MRLTWTLALGCAALIGCGGGEAQIESTTTSEPIEETAGVEVTAAPATADPSDVHIEGDHLTIDGHINFAPDSDVILEDSSELIDHIALMIGNHTDDIAHLKIIGHTDVSGNVDHNQDLSNRRAAAVEQALRDRGVSIELEHFGAGESTPLCSEVTDDCHARNRRVEFLIVPE